MPSAITASRSQVWVACAALLISTAAQGQHDDSYTGVLGDLGAQLGAQQRGLEQQLASKSAASDSLSALGPELISTRERLHKNARALYRISRGGMLPVAGGMAALLGHASRVSRLEQVVGHDLEKLKRLERSSIALRKELAQMDAQIASSQRELSSLETARLSAVRERTVQRSLEAAFTEPAPRVNERTQYGLSIVGGMPQERFTEQRGNLALPVSGPSSIQDATRAESDGPGLELAASQGAAVRAAAAGKVAFAESYGSYGRLVILEHGDRYYSVYGGLANMDVQVGDTLSKSARIGSSGSQPIYFEVRRGTKTQDARAWLGL